MFLELLLIAFVSQSQAAEVPASDASPSPVASHSGTSDGTSMVTQEKPGEMHSRDRDDGGVGTASHEKVTSGEGNRSVKNESKSGNSSAVPAIKNARGFVDEDLSGKGRSDKSVDKALGIRRGRFEFGSYGRVGLTHDQDGRPAPSTNIVAHGPRLDERSYIELDLRYVKPIEPGVVGTVLVTPAFSDFLFHYTGVWDSSVAVRNAYFQVDFHHDFGMWVGSRMYRGDDIYLLDFWPLDNLNTVGAGVFARHGGWTVEVHTGMNRVLSRYQFQSFEVPGPYVGSVDVITLERQRVISSLKIQYMHYKGMVGWKAKAYAEVHHLPSGTYNALEQEADRLYLPADRGAVAGLQLGVWRDKTFVNVFLKYSRGLAAYGEFSTPLGVGFYPDMAPDYTVWNAWDFLAGTSMNLEIGRLGIQGGAYVRWFEDADERTTDFDDGVEGVLVLRPYVWLWHGFAIGGEVSHQYTDRKGLNPWDGMPVSPRVTKFAIIPTWFAGKSTYSRPVIRAYYEMVYMNNDARRLYPPEDLRFQRSTHHIVGINAEWWFNSSTYK